MKLSSIIRIGILIIVYPSLTLAIRFGHPYFLIMSEGSEKNVLIETDPCISGAFTNAEVKLTKFCVSGIWVLVDSDCATDQSHAYLVSGRDSCFQLTTEITAKRFMPILQNISDFEGFAFALPNTYGYFVRLNPANRTELKPISQPRSDWTVMTINFGLYGRHINEFVTTGGKMGLRTCYAPDTAVVTQFYKLSGEGDGDTMIEPYEDSQDCRTGFNLTQESFHVRTGSLLSLGDDGNTAHNSSHSYLSEERGVEAKNIFVPFPAATVSGPCSSDSAVPYPPYNNSVPYEKFPQFPHMLPPEIMDNIIVDEIQETGKKYIERKLFNAVIPSINRSEYLYILMSNKILGRFCCNPSIKTKDLDAIRILFRLSFLYYRQYHPYEEIGDAAEDHRIMTALNTCYNRTDIPVHCVSVNDSTTCPIYINTTNFNGTFYEFNMPVDIQFEIGNLDYVTEVIWKSMLFVHYYCAPFFENPSDHSAFNVKVEGFFNPMVKTKWTQPRSVHTVYELLLNEINLKAVAETIDHCVDAAQQSSDYKKWLERPGSQDTHSRKKRATNNGAKQGSDSCVPQTTPKLFCLNKQFDVYDKKLLNPFKPSPTCNNVHSKIQQYKYIHANYYDSKY